LLLTALACAGHRFAVPAGPGVPAPDGAAAWAEASRACRDARSYSASLRVSNGTRMPALSLLAIVTAEGRIRLEASSLFWLAGTATRAQLLLTDGNKLVAGRADEIVDAIVGIKLGPERLLALLTGCVSRSPALVGAERFGKLIAVTTGDGRVFVEPRDGRWQVVAGEVDGLLVDYRFLGYWPAEWRATTEHLTPEATLKVSVDDSTVNDPSIAQHPEAFTLKIPVNAVPMTLDELRATFRKGL
jgi:hypothetical protein